MLIAIIIKKAYCQSQHNQYSQNSFLEDPFMSQQDPYKVNYQQDQRNDKYVHFTFHQYTNLLD
ncbi:unnamed protein product [Paramecium primaurelia]|uniref:Uncharacterized protein n=1 Tax=Paramecium primaurelia TaxID=5886 RepID=A0A8S1PG66_PARPR|nr:unnamed protein product [Paramecium primaurelia]